MSDKPQPQPATPPRPPNPTTHPTPARPVPPPSRPRPGSEVAPAWMTPQHVAEESGRHPETVYLALRRGLLCGSQAHAKARWRVKRTDFNSWMEQGAPIEARRVRKLRSA